MDVYKVKYTRWEKQAKGLSDVFLFKLFLGPFPVLMRTE
jgi:hypothetical protein